MIHKGFDKLAYLRFVKNRAMMDELEKIAIFKPNLTALKYFLKSPIGAISTATGTGAIGLGFVDTRDKPDLEAKTILPYWDEVKKYAKPGDVIVGANRPPTILSYFKDFKMQYDKARKNNTRERSIEIAKELVNPVTMISKIGDPIFSHAAIIGPSGKTIYGGGGSARDITLRDLPKNKKELLEFNKRGLDPYYALLRPNKKESNKLNKIIKNKGSEDALKKVELMAGSPKDYHLSRAIWEQIKRWTLPKINKEEFLKSDTVRKLEKKMTGGICSTTAGLLSDRTISGKEAKKVLPKDIIESPDFDIVANIGSERNVPITTQMLFSAPKYGVKAGAGILAGGATYGILQGVKAMLKSDKINLFRKII